MSEPCTCGALDCYQCHPENFRWENGRVVSIGQEEPDWGQVVFEREFYGE